MQIRRQCHVHNRRRHRFFPKPICLFQAPSQIMEGVLKVLICHSYQKEQRQSNSNAREWRHSDSSPPLSPLSKYKQLP